MIKTEQKKLRETGRDDEEMRRRGESRAVCVLRRHRYSQSQSFHVCSVQEVVVLLSYLVSSQCVFCLIDGVVGKLIPLFRKNLILILGIY